MHRTMTFFTRFRVTRPQKSNGMAIEPTQHASWPTTCTCSGPLDIESPMVPCGLTLSAKCTRFFHSQCLGAQKRVFRTTDFTQLGLPPSMMVSFALQGDRDWSKPLLRVSADGCLPPLLPGVAAACDHCLALAGLSAAEVGDLGFTTLAQALAPERAPKRSRSASSNEGPSPKRATPQSSSLIELAPFSSFPLANPLPSPCFEDISGKPLDSDRPPASLHPNRVLSPLRSLSCKGGFWSDPLSDAPACSPLRLTSEEQLELLQRAQQVQRDIVSPLTTTSPPVCECPV